MSKGMQDKGSVQPKPRISNPAVDPVHNGSIVNNPEEFVAPLVWRTAAELGFDPLALLPLGNQIDLDAVTSLATDGCSSISFTCGNCDVFVGHDGQLTVNRIGKESKDDLV